MTWVFVDTSAVLALVNPKDEAHDLARSAFEILTKRESPLLSTSFVVVELCALLGRRLGLDAIRRFRGELAPLIEVVWVDESLHESGLDLLLERGKRALSLVDTVSFVTMRRRGIEEAFAYDPHFEREGFTLV